MNKQLTILAASLLAAFATSVTYAGQISSSSVTLAREVIESNAQIVRAASKSYNFAGDLDARFNAQRLQVQLTLPGAATWGATAGAGTVIISEANGVLVDVLVKPYTVTTFVTADRKTLYANIEIPVGSASIITTPIITFNPGAVIGTNNSGITNLRGVAAETMCLGADTNADVTFKHYTTFSSTALQTGPNPDGEDARIGSTNTGRLLNFTENLRINFVPSAGTLVVDGTTQSTFNATGSVAPAFVSTTVANLGTVAIAQPGAGLDLDYSTQYGAAAVSVTTPATAAAVIGTIEALRLDITLTAPGGFGTGTVRLASNALCTTFVGPATTLVPGATTAIIPLTVAADIIAVRAAPHSICYTVAGTLGTTLPSTVVSVVGNLLKAAPSANNSIFSAVNGLQEQKNTCTGNLTPVGAGAVRIDVRNYATTRTAGGFVSVIRLINPSETNTATIFGQLIHADGSYGGWGQLAVLAPRASTNMTSTQIDPLLTGTPVTNGTGFVAGPLAPVARTAADRLRITATGVNTLRVQNYMFNPANGFFIEVSGSQGVDFGNVDNQAPGSGAEQTVTQDAQRGIAR